MWPSCRGDLKKEDAGSTAAMGRRCAILWPEVAESGGGGMDAGTAAVIIGLGLACTLLVGMAAQWNGRRITSQAWGRKPPTAPPPAPPPDPYREMEEDVAAVHEAIEEARRELLWLREQVARERGRLEGLRRQVPPSPPGSPPHGPQAAPPPLNPDSPWAVLGLRPGAGAEEVRRRYRLLSRVWHPDRFTDGSDELRAEAEAMMAKLNKAHTSLGNQPAGARGAEQRPR